MTRLELLCKVHGVRGGTIHQYERFYGRDILGMSEEEFNRFFSWVENILKKIPELRKEFLKEI